MGDGQPDLPPHFWCRDPAFSGFSEEVGAPEIALPRDAPQVAAEADMAGAVAHVV